MSVAKFGHFVSILHQFESQFCQFWSILIIFVQHVSHVRRLLVAKYEIWGAIWVHLVRNAKRNLGRPFAKESMGWLEAIFREILVAIWVPGRNREIRAKFGCLWQNLGKIRASQSHFGVSLLPKSDLVGQSDKLAWCISNITRNLGQNMGPDGEIWASKFG